MRALRKGLVSLLLLVALPALRGPAVEADALAGRVVVVAFFASRCPPCGPEFEAAQGSKRP